MLSGLGDLSVLSFCYFSITPRLEDESKYKKYSSKIQCESNTDDLVQRCILYGNAMHITNIVFIDKTVVYCLTQPNGSTYYINRDILSTIRNFILSVLRRKYQVNTLTVTKLKFFFSRICPKSTD